MRKKIIQFWKYSKIYQIIDNMISASFRKRLKNDNFTILCSNCIGGVIYHRLGKQFLSPTINMFFSQPDFVSFCMHLDYYLQQKLHFINTKFNYPVAELRGDWTIPTITLNFNHASDVRINRKNLYVILYKLDGLTVEQAKQLEYFPCKNKVLLTAEKLSEISWAYYIKPNERQQYASAYLGRDVFGKRWFEKKWDFVDFLNK